MSKQCHHLGFSNAISQALLCSQSDNIRDLLFFFQSQNIADAVFYCKWYTMEPEDAKSCVIMLTYTKEVLMKITFLKIYTVSRDLFKDVSKQDSSNLSCLLE